MEITPSLKVNDSARNGGFRACYIDIVTGLVQTTGRGTVSTIRNARGPSSICCCVGDRNHRERTARHPGVPVALRCHIVLCSPFGMGPLMRIY